jgi:5-methylcytosine-specific restriction endonuclease McrA
MVNKKVLVLNNSYEPLMICSLKRAIILIFQQKALLTERYDFDIHSISSSFPCPSVIRLNYYVHRPYQEPILNKKNILKRDGYRCQYCGKNSQPMTIDHVIPKSFGGKETWENLVCACEKCNTTKADRTPQLAGMRLLKKPKKPSPIFFLQTLVPNPPSAWKSYLFLD